MPGVNEELAVGPVAPLLPQLPQVSQLFVSSTLSRTVVPAGATGGGPEAGVGLGEDAGPVVVWVVAGLPPQETDIISKKEITRAPTANHQRRKKPPQNNHGEVVGLL